MKRPKALRSMPAQCQGMNGTRRGSISISKTPTATALQLQLLLQTSHPPSRGQQQINTLAFVLPLWVQTINKYHSTRRGLSRRQTRGRGHMRGFVVSKLLAPHSDWQIYRLLIKVQATWPSVNRQEPANCSSMRRRVRSPYVYAMLDHRAGREHSKVANCISAALPLD